MDELFAKLALQTASTVTRIAINHATNAALVKFLAMAYYFIEYED
jgi:hypothetical protein